MSAAPGVTQTAGAADLLMDALRIGVYAVAAVLVVLAMWLLWGRRGEEAVEARSGRATRMKWWFGAIDDRTSRLTTPTRLTFAVAALLLGYHLFAWTAPGHILPFRVPIDLWFILVGGAGIACFASLWMDRRQAMDPPESQ